MLMSMQISAATIDPALLDLPWELSLEDWPQDVLAALPRGLSRHVVRFVNLSERVIAVKEIGESVAHREYALLRDLVRLGAPCVTPTAVITGRMSADGERLNSALVTEHLSYSLPYRALFSQYMSPDTATRLIDALAVLLVRLHLLGFYWGDVSLSNTLFRRDAGSFAAYLVDAETGEALPRGRSDGGQAPVRHRRRPHEHHRRAHGPAGRGPPGAERRHDRGRGPDHRALPRSVGDPHW